jgi:hypothetical protein
MGTLLRLIRSQRRALAEEVAFENKSPSARLVSFARSFAALPPSVDDPGRVTAIACALAVKLSPGPPNLWPSEAAALLQDAGLGEFSEDGLRRVKCNAAFSEFDALFGARPPPEDELEYGQRAYQMRELLIEAGNAGR